MRKTRVILISLLLYGKFGTDLLYILWHTLLKFPLHNAVVEVMKQFTECKTITINKKSSRQNAEEKAKKCNGSHFLDLSSSSLMGIWNASTFNEWIWVSLIEFDPIQVLSVRSDPNRSGPVRSRFCQRPFCSAPFYNEWISST